MMGARWMLITTITILILTMQTQAQQPQSSLASQMVRVLQNKTLIPPLPILTELASVVSFVVDSADDVAEDAVKGAAAYGLYKATQVLGSDRRSPFTGPDATILGVAFGAAVYVPLNDFADDMGNVVEEMRNAVVKRANVFFLRPTGNTKDPPLIPPEVYASLSPLSKAVATVARALDDVVEDVFTGSCLYAHALVGSFLKERYLSSLLGAPETSATAPNSAWTGRLGTALALGVPASQYSQCNDYGDLLGDVLQTLIHHAILPSSPP